MPPVSIPGTGKTVQLPQSNSTPPVKNSSYIPYFSQFSFIKYLTFKKVELDHWAYGPHHVWVYPENGQILRMWQPFNGLQVYPGGI